MERVEREVGERLRGRECVIERESGERMLKRDTERVCVWRGESVGVRISFICIVVGQGNPTRGPE